MHRSPMPAKSAAPRGRRLSGLLLLLGGVLVAGYYLAFDPATEGLFPRCLILQTTGYRCPGCGGQRALHALLSGQWTEALHHNAFLLVILPVGALSLLTLLAPERTKPLGRVLRHPLFVAGIAGLTLLFTLLRNRYGY